MPGLGSVVGRYEVQQQLGQGGMGQVYTGIDPALGRRVAIKVLHSGGCIQSDLVGRLLNEARAAASIGHPGIVQIFDVGTTTDGLPYIVMELLEGQTLGSRLRNGGAMPEPEPPGRGSLGDTEGARGCHNVKNRTDANGQAPFFVLNPTACPRRTGRTSATHTHVSGASAAPR